MTILDDFDRIIGRERAIEQSKEYGQKIGKNIASNILWLIYRIEDELKTLKWVRDNQEQWYPYIGITVEELEVYIDELEKKVTIFKSM